MRQSALVRQGPFWRRAGIVMIGLGVARSAARTCRPHLGGGQLTTPGSQFTRREADCRWTPMPHTGPPGAEDTATKWRLPEPTLSWGGSIAPDGFAPPASFPALAATPLRKPRSNSLAAPSPSWCPRSVSTVSSRSHANGTAPYIAGAAPVRGMSGQASPLRARSALATTGHAAGHCLGGRRRTRPAAWT
jgi:hypothetical protein